MNVQLTDAQRQRRDEHGYVRVTALLLFDKGRTLASVAADLGLEKYLLHEPPGYWGLLTGRNWRTCARR